MKGLAPILGVVVVGAIAAAGGVLLTGGGDDPGIGQDPLGGGPTAVTSTGGGEPVLPGQITGRVTGPLKVRPGANPLTPTGPAAPNPASMPGGVRAAKRNTKRKPSTPARGRMLDGLERSIHGDQRDPAAIRMYLEQLFEEGPGAIPDVIDALERAPVTDRGFRKQLITLLERFDHADAAAALAAMGRDGTDDRELRKMAMLSLGKMNPAHGLAPLIEIATMETTDEVYRVVRMHAVQAMGIQADDRAFDTLRNLMTQDSDASIRRHAVNSLSKYRRQEVTDLLIDVANNDADYQTRAWAVNSLAKRPDPRTGRELTGMLDRWPDPKMRETIYMALSNRRDAQDSGVIRSALARETKPHMIKRAVMALVNSAGGQARDTVESLQRRYRTHRELEPWLRSQLKVIERIENQSRSGGDGGPPKPPAPPRAPK